MRWHLGSMACSALVSGCASAPDEVGAVSGLREVARFAGVPEVISGDGYWLGFRRDDSRFEFVRVADVEVSVAVDASAEMRIFPCGAGSRFAIVEGLRFRLVDPAAGGGGVECDLARFVPDAAAVLGVTRDGGWLGVRAVDKSLRLVRVEEPARGIALPRVEAVAMDWLAVVPGGESVIVASMGPWGAPHRLARVARLDLWSLQESDLHRGGFGLRSLSYLPASPNPVAGIVFSPNGELLFSSWHNLARIDVAKQRVVERIEGQACLGIRTLGDRWAISTHLEVAGSLGIRWELRELPNLRLSAARAMDADLLAAAAPARFVVISGGEAVVYQVSESR